MSDYWKDNGIEKPQQIVVCAACRYDGQIPIIICGARHWDKLMREQLAFIQIGSPSFKSASFEQGFIDQFGDFLTRSEAMKVVKASGQPFNLERNGSDVELYSEGLY